ncbi:hypothetical protein Pla108_37640 [Botrimarina colliarenosi]|uniref:DUF429 domain-containing protein n=1 Tax=Botrimarina colliarenosi TaxID=2528001 RepID=A0A5C6A2G1_9BACT|nr:DUF429 domain-containing protein [Botrimarina colliarenosi]TWT94052.1 hypothetical protein Pla108_37640 [Botrimarina colliarenosi]
MTRNAPLVAGVDGCPRGWVAAVGPLQGDAIWLSVASSLRELIDLHPGVVAWAVDIPIGLAEDGPRECDGLARRRLGPRRAVSVFSAPPRCAVADVDYPEACRLAAAASGKKISKQAWHIGPKIRETRSLLIAEPRLRRRLFESHPELCFQRLAGGAALGEPKKSIAGSVQRRRLLAEAFGAEAVDRVLTQAAASRRVGVDDALDAMACWTAAARAAAGEAESLPPKPPADADGLRMAMVC